MLWKCFKCKRIFAMKKTEKKLIRQDDINISETLTQPHPSGEIQAMAERFVAGKRNFYEITYSCRFCGAKQSKTVCRDTKKS